jgi:hypothetical protein
MLFNLYRLGAATELVCRLFLIHLFFIMFLSVVYSFTVLTKYQFLWTVRAKNFARQLLTPV